MELAELENVLAATLSSDQTIRKTAELNLKKVWLFLENYLVSSYSHIIYVSKSTEFGTDYDISLSRLPLILVQHYKDDSKIFRLNRYQHFV